MTSAIRIAVAAALSFASITLAHAQSADVEKRQLVALADTSAASQSAGDETPDRYAGRYLTADGQAFFITVDDDALTLETPESWGAVIALRALDAQSFATADGDVLVTFAFTHNGEVSGASIARASENAVATTREALRGIVTILDSPEQIAAAGLHRGVVTIVDVVNEFATSPVAASTVASSY